MVCVGRCEVVNIVEQRTDGRNPSLVCHHARPDTILRNGIGLRIVFPRLQIAAVEHIGGGCDGAALQNEQPAAFPGPFDILRKAQPCLANCECVRGDREGRGASSDYYSCFLAKR